MAAAISVQTCGADVHRSLGNTKAQAQAQVHITDMDSSNKDMPRTYESEEEEVAETEVAGHNEHLLSPIEVDSDEADSEPEPEDSDLDDFQQMMLYQSRNSDDASTLHVPRSPLFLADGSRPSSITTVKRTSVIELMSPTSLQAPELENVPSRSMSSSPNQTSSAQTVLASSERPVSGTPSFYQSFYSDGVSSDEEYGSDMSFSIATPVTLYAPQARPSIVSISPSPPRSRSESVPMIRREIRERPALSRQHSNRSSSSRANQPRTAKNQHIYKDHSQKATYAGNSCSPDSSIPTFSTPNWSSSILHASSSSDSDSQASAAPATSNKRRTASHCPRPPQVSGSVVQPRRMAESAGPGSTGPNEVAQSHIERSSSWYTKRRNEPPPVPMLRSIHVPASSGTSSPLSSATSSLDSPKTRGFRRGQGQLSGDKHSFNFSSTELSRPIFGNTRDNSPVIPSHYPSVEGPYPTPPLTGKHPPYPITGFRDRTQSVSSMASSSSMSSHPTFDSVSIRSTQHRYRQQFYTGRPTTPTDRSSSRGSMSPVQKSYSSRLGSKMSISTTNLGLFSTSASEMEDSPMSNSRYSIDRHQDSPVGEPSRKMSRPKSIKLFNGTGESVTRVGNRAIAGLGSILRRKSIVPEA